MIPKSLARNLKKRSLNYLKYIIHNSQPKSRLFDLKEVFNKPQISLHHLQATLATAGVKGE